MIYKIQQPTRPLSPLVVFSVSAAALSVFILYHSLMPLVTNVSAASTFPTATPTVTGAVPTPTSVNHTDDEIEDEDDQNENEHSSQNKVKKEKESDCIQIQYKSRIFPTAVPSLARPSPAVTQTITPTPILSGINQLSIEDKSFLSAFFKFLSSLFG